ncbi:hypothetical protein PhCBS80983_g05726 [Powellomyces hirtus]|uniref:DUF4246 domain-containing protein n=1 Tax=Powellomyces hirtus TaxID=109895 RepID=A0A507DV31_9FUNG|nr:hypothetical protein PhCBS80983_g05726 [Powellomyces hirtus]
MADTTPNVGAGIWITPPAVIALGLESLPLPKVSFRASNGPLSRLELATIYLGGLVRNKVMWSRKAIDATIVDKWRSEMRTAFAKAEGTPPAQQVDISEEGPEDVIRAFFSEEFMEFVLADCLHDARGWEALEDDIVAPSAVRGAYQADQPHNHDQVAELLELLKPLEDIPNHRKDWHPNTGNQVLDLVHPSLFCLEHGRSRILDPTVAEGLTAPADCLKHLGSGSVLPNRPEPPNKWAHIWQLPKVDQFQWLPAEFHIEDLEVTIQSYINNLHPVRHKRIYRALEKIFVGSSELLDFVVSDIANGSHRSARFRVPEHEDEGEVIHPSLPPKPSRPGGFHQFISSGSMQVIVKIATICLDPANPKYAGGTWHLEGTSDEAIVATAIHYLSLENITTSRLSFRRTFDDTEISYPQDDHRVKEIYGIVRDEPAVQYVGSVTAVSGRCIAFPNSYQHRVEPFELADPTKPGHRKIICFFLVNPQTRVTSTRDVPPQQFSWWFTEVFSDPCSRLSRFPLDIRIAIGKFVEWPMKMADAKDQRARLTESRKEHYAVRNGDFEHIVSLCEH